MKKNDFIKLLNEELDIEKTITLDSEFNNVLDSISIMSLICVVKEKFNKNLSFQDFKKIENTKDLFAIIGDEKFQ